MKEGRTKMLLAILGIVALFAAWQWIGPALGMGGGEKTGGRDDYADLTSSVGRVPGAGRARARPQQADEVVDLRIAELGGTPRDYKPGRDPWRFVLPPPPPPAPTPPPPRPLTEAELRAREEAERRMAEERARQEAARLAELAKPKPPPFTLQYLGKFGPEERPIAVFTDGKNILNVQEGEVIQGQFIVSQIGLESVEIQFVGFPDWPPQRLPPTGASR
ncbi:MAG TPA: hypothetical protein VNW71_02060 [Thermoanaerobaculia bacterium]|nr:hypothetical protein [Thermoanaerobaculia bacterium]